MQWSRGNGMLDDRGRVDRRAVLIRYVGVHPCMCPCLGIPSEGTRRHECTVWYVRARKLPHHLHPILERSLPYIYVLHRSCTHGCMHECASGLVLHGRRDLDGVCMLRHIHTRTLTHTCRATHACMHHGGCMHLQA